MNGPVFSFRTDELKNKRLSQPSNTGPAYYHGDIQKE